MSHLRQTGVTADPSHLCWRMQGCSSALPRGVSTQQGAWWLKSLPCWLKPEGFCLKGCCLPEKRDTGRIQSLKSPSNGETSFPLKIETSARARAPLSCVRTPLRQGGVDAAGPCRKKTVPDHRRLSTSLPSLLKYSTVLYAADTWLSQPPTGYQPHCFAWDFGLSTL